MAVTHLSLTTDTTSSAIKTGCTWSLGKNRLVWSKPADTIGGFAFNAQAWRAVFLQRSSVDNTTPTGGSPSQFYATTRKAPPVDTFWTTVFSAVIGLEGDWPTTFEEDMQHSQLWYYRLIFIAAPNGLTSSTGRELDSNIATIVQPFDLSICQQPPACTVSQGCTPRLVWDAPVLTVPFINGTHTVAGLCNGANNLYRINVDYRIGGQPILPAPTSYDIYKSTSGPDSLAFVANTVSTPSPLNACNDWYDSDPDHSIWYQFVANRPNGSRIPSNILALSY